MVNYCAEWFVGGLIGKIIIVADFFWTAYPMHASLLKMALLGSHLGPSRLEIAIA